MYGDKKLIPPKGAPIHVFLIIVFIPWCLLLLLLLLLDELWRFRVVFFLCFVFGFWFFGGFLIDFLS